MAHAVPLASVAGILKKPHFGGVDSEGADQRGGLVARAIVNHNDLSGPAALADAAGDRFESAQDPRALVVGRNDNTVLRIAHSVSECPE